MHILSTITLALLMTTTYGYNSYMVLCPDTVRPGMDFTVRFHKLAPFESLRFTAEIMDNSNTISQGTAIVPKGGTGANVVLKLPRDLPNSAYSLEVKADIIEGATIFKNSTSLRYMEKGFSIFVQTDKAIYRPGQKVQFRAFGTNPDLSILYSSMDIAMYDPNNNKIAQWLNVSDSSGVFQGALQLADQPPLGDWKLEVELSGSSKSLVFTVAEYVLPRFEVTVTVPSFGLISDKYLSGTVKTKYTFDKGVEGNGTLVVKKKYYEQEYRMSFQIHGVYRFNIDMETLRNTFKSLNYATLDLVAEVEEGLTGNIRSGSTEIKYYEREEKLVFMESANNFKPGLQSSCYLFLSDQDDKPLARNAHVNVTVTMYYTSTKEEPVSPPEPMTVAHEDEIMRKMILPMPFPTRLPEKFTVLGPKTIHVPQNGIAQFSFAVPIHITRISVESKFGKLQTSKRLDKFKSTSGTYIQVSIKTKNPKAGARCTFKIESTQKRIKVNYMIMSKGMIVKVGSTKLRRTSKNLRMKLSSDMAPSARIVVYWTRKDAEIIADSVQFNVKGIFENKVNIEFLTARGKKTQEEQPGKKVRISVKADPGSMCNVLTVDKSVLLLKSGNDITPEKVEEELELYDSKAPPPCRGGFFPCLLSFYPMPISGVDVTAIFQNSGIKVLTDAFLYQLIRPMYRRHPEMMAMEDAMPMMGMAKNADVGSGGPRVRTLFPETWVYESAKANSDGTATIETTVPDTITSWVASAFAVNRKSGLGVAPDTANLNVFLKFFIRLELPYSVVRAEQVILQANIFNFFDTVLEVEVVLKKSSSFKNIMIARDHRGRSHLLHRHREVNHKIQVAPGGGTTVNFPIIPVELGNIDIEVQATSNKAGDAIRKQLLVEPEGIPESYNLPFLIDLTRVKSFYTNASITLPDDLVLGSVRIRISAIGDLMGPSISGLTNLLQMPFGCGEQNMVTFVPNIFVIKYLKAINNLKPDDLNKATGFMLSGYQKELTFQHFDGSFSAFGNSDPSGSTWLTAFVVKSFSQAKPYIYIDPTIMKRAVDWILSQYNEKLEKFDEPGRVIHTEMQGGSISGARNLATYTLIALLEAQDAKFTSSKPADLTAIITRASNVLEQAAPGLNDLYNLATASYALALAKSDKLDSVLSALDKKATNEGGMKYWQVEEEPDMSGLRWVPPHHQARSRNIETTAYVLLAYATKKDIVNGLPILKWLVDQRNPNGGFGSTQDTVIALQALAEFGALIHSDNFNVKIDVQGTPVTFSHTFDIAPRNALLLQAIHPPEQTRNVGITARGSGMALLEIAVNYNVFGDYLQPSFQLKLSFSDETINGFKLKVCFRWLGKGESGMSVVEVGLLSGFSAEKFSITDLSIMKKVEDGYKKLIVYLDEVPGDENSCFTVRMQREGLVAGSQPAMVKVFDYYQPEKHAFSMYQPELLRNSSVCNLAQMDLGC